MFERRVTLAANRTLSPRSFVLTYRCPEIAATAAPGQFVMISASLCAEPLLRRPMAVYAVEPDEGTFAILVERTGRGTTLMAAARPGDEARVLGPLGRPFRLGDETAASEQVEHLLVMGGVGAAPFPMVAAALKERGARVRAFVGGRTAADLLCLDDFSALGVDAVCATDDGSYGHHGFVTGALEAHLAASRTAVRIYSCGPTPMMRAVDVIARRLGLPHQVSLEAPMACGIGVCLSCVVRVRDGDDWIYRRICREGPVFDAATLVWS